MDTQLERDTLVDAIATTLGAVGYSRCEKGELDGIPFLARIMTPREWMVRQMCAVLRVPAEVADAPACKEFVEDARRSLTRRYARFPWFKELGTFYVLLCESQLFQELSTSGHQFKDRTGLHMNVLLGTCIVDVENYRFCTHATWGLLYSGKHFRAMEDVVRQWCERLHTEVSKA